MHHKLAALLAVLVLGVATVPVAAGEQITATLDGNRLRLDRIPSYRCHDFGYPVIRCFSSADGYGSDLAAHFQEPELSARLLLGGYVTVYEDVGFDGAFISLANDYTSLATIGWNDRISSFESFGASGSFREHSPPGGFSYGFSGSTQVSSLGSSYNDKFSALDLN